MVIGPSTNVVDANDIVIFGGVNAGYNGSVVVGGQSATNPARIFSVDTGGAISIPAWGTRGAFFSTVGQTVTDNTSATGTVAAAVFNSFGAPTINATNASVVYTDIANLYVGAPLTTGNASATNLWGIWNAGKTRLDGTLSLGGANNNSNGILQITASTSATAGIAFGNDTPQASIYRSAASTLTTPGTWEMSGGSGAVDLHIGSSGLTNGGGYMGSAGTARFFVTAGGFFNGSWTASATSFSGLDLGSTTGGVSVYANTGLTAGNTFSPATTAVFGPTGTTIGSSATPTSGQLGITYTTASSSTTTGAIVDSGGLGVAGAAWIGATTNTIGLSNTGVSTFAPVARSSGAASYFTITAPSDTGITTATESIGVNIQGATRTWVDGTVATQREYYFGAPTYNKTTTSATFTTAATVDISGAPVAGAGVTITNPYALRVESGAGLFANALNVAGTAYTYGALPSGATTAGPAITVPATTYTVTGTNTATEFSANYYATPTFTDASVGTITDAFISFYNGPVAAAGGSLVITRRHSVGILDSTSAASSITGGLVVATALGTTATSVGIGGGNINAGGTITSGGAIAAGTTLTTAAGVTAAAGVWNLGALRTSTALVTSTTQVIQIAVGGTLFSLMTCTTNP
jgi:hypothetical protein